MSAEALIARLGLQPHPEGGHYRETYRDRPTAGGRGNLTTILYLLKSGEISRWHRVTDAVEMTPRSRDFPFRRATVWFDREDGIPRRLDLDEVQQRRVIDLGRVEKNIPLADSVFQFVKPAGARIVTP